MDDKKITMPGNVILICSKEGFLVKGIEAKLNDNGIPVEYCSLDIKKLEVKSKNAELYILVMDESIKGKADFLVYLKDICDETERKVIAVGGAEEESLLHSFIPDHLILKVFPRPLDIPRLLETATGYLENNSGENRKKTILIVDDDETYMKLIYEWLKDYYHVEMVNSGVTAFTWLGRNKADLVLLDYEMPIATGATVFEMLKNETETDQIPVMFLTGKSDKKTIMEVVGLKPVDYLLKTIDKPGLLLKLSNFFTRRYF